MKFKCHNKKNSLICFGFILFFCLNWLSVQCFADNVKVGKNDNETYFITVMPLNITADDKNRKTIRGSVEKFLLQRLNNRKISAEIPEKLIGLNPDDINKLYTSLNANLVDERIKQVGGKGYVCGGNIVVLGTSVISDFFVYNIESGTKVIEHSASGNDIGTVLTSANVFTGKVKSQFSTKHGAGLESDLTIAKTSSGKSNPAKKILIKSDKVEGEITSVVFSKFDDTGKSYAVFSLAGKIVAMEKSENKFVLKSEFQNNKTDIVVGLASIDTDQDGVEELVVSNIKSDHRTISSYVLKWENGIFAKKLSNLKWIFSSPGSVASNNFLYAQKNKTLKSTLDSGVVKVFFEKGALKVSEKTLSVPKWVHLPGFAEYGDSDAFHVAFRPDSRLCVFDKKGESFWESNDLFGGTKLFFTEINPVDKERDNRLWLSSPVKLADVYPENKNMEIIVVKNNDTTKNFLSRTKSFKDGRITVFSVKELSCSLSGQSEKITGFISGFDMKPDATGNDSLLLYSVVQKGKNIFSTKRSFIVLQNTDSLQRIIDN